MKCPKCSAELPEGLQFCPNCGSPVAPAQPAAPKAPKVKKPKAPRKPLPQGSLKDKANYLVESLPVDKKLKKPIAIGGCILAAFLVLLLVAGIFRLIFGINGGVLTDMTDALHKNLKEGNFHVVYDGYKLDVQMNAKKGEIMAYGKNNGRVYAIYKDCALTESYSGGYYKSDMEDELKMLFDYINKYDTLYDVDFEELMEQQDVDPDDLGVDARAIQKGYKKLLDKLNSKSWLEDNGDLEIEKDGGETTYSISINMYTFGTTALDCFEDAFEKGKDFKNAKEMLEGMKKELKKQTVDVEYVIEDGYLMSLEISVPGMGGFSVEFDDIGEVEIDEKELKSIYKDAD